MNVASTFASFEKIYFFFPPVVFFSNLTYIRILIGTILCRKRTYIEHEKVYKRHTFGKYIHKERILSTRNPLQVLCKNFVYIFFFYCFLLLHLPFLSWTTTYTLTTVERGKKGNFLCTFRCVRWLKNIKWKIYFNMQKSSEGKENMCAV